MLYASNYKGGSGSLQEDFSKSTGRQSLKLYSDLLSEIHESFKECGLENIDEEDLQKLIDYAGRMIGLCFKHHIKGLGVPYCSALFHMHFPSLIPVIDRNVLLGIGDIVKVESIQKSGQIWKIEKFYTSLIKKLHTYIRENRKSLRDADKELFDKGKIIYETYKLQTNL